MKKCFGKKTMKQIIKLILENGEPEVNEDERKLLTDNLLNDIANVI